MALARAFIREPRLLLLDEPFGALDALTRLKMHGLLRQLCERHQPATLLVTHDVDEAISLADRILVVKDGHISLDHRVPPRRAQRTGGVDAARPPPRGTRRVRARDTEQPLGEEQMKLSFSTRAVRGAAVAVPIAAASLAIALSPAARHRQEPARASAPRTSRSASPSATSAAPSPQQSKLTGPEGFAYSKGLLQKWLKPDKVTIKSTAVFANGPLLTAALVGGSLQLGETR